MRTTRLLDLPLHLTTPPWRHQALHTCWWETTPSPDNSCIINNNNNNLTQLTTNHSAGPWSRREKSQKIKSQVGSKQNCRKMTQRNRNAETLKDRRTISVTPLVATAPWYEDSRILMQLAAEGVPWPCYYVIKIARRREGSLRWEREYLQEFVLITR